MAKRKQQAPNSDGESSDSEPSLIDVDFDFFDINREVDYQAIKRLLKQLFQSDSDSFDLHELAELVLKQEIGTTVKTDGTESDPYAILTVLNVHAHQENKAVKSVIDYVLRKSGNAQVIQDVLAGSGPLGLVVCERLINMPVQVMPHMYRMLVEEMKAAVGQGKAYNFTHFLWISRVYHLTPEEESLLIQSSNARQPSSKKSKKGSAVNAAAEPARPQDGIYSFHPEDDLISQHSTLKFEYQYDNTDGGERGKESFGLDNRGRVMLMNGDKFEGLVKEMGEKYSAV